MQVLSVLIYISQIATWNHPCFASLFKPAYTSWLSTSWRCSSSMLSVFMMSPRYIMTSSMSCSKLLMTRWTEEVPVLALFTKSLLRVFITAYFQILLQKQLLASVAVVEVELREILALAQQTGHWHWVSGIIATGTAGASLPGVPQFEQKCMRALSQAAATYTSARVAGAATRSLNDPTRRLRAHPWARSVALLSKQGRAQIPRTTPQETETDCSVVHVCCTTMITFARAGINWGLPVHVFACNN